MLRDGDHPGNVRELLAPVLRRCVVVTGGSGTLGLPLCQALSARGHTVIAVDQREPGRLPAGVAFRVADLNDLDALSAAFAGVEAVIHTAALHGYHLPHRIGRIYDVARAERELGYRPRHNFAEFLAELQGAGAALRRTG